MSNLKYIKPEQIVLKNNSAYSEKWVQQRIAEDPSLLGLGDLVLKDKERIQRMRLTSYVRIWFANKLAP